MFTTWTRWTVMKWKIFGLTRGGAAGEWSKVTLHHTSCRNRMFSRISTSWACSKANSHQNYEAVSQHAKTWTTFHGQKVHNYKNPFKQFVLLLPITYSFPLYKCAKVIPSDRKVTFYELVAQQCSPVWLFDLRNLEVIILMTHHTNMGPPFIIKLLHDGSHILCHEVLINNRWKCFLLHKKNHF